jgi:serine/threonine protein kinase
VYRGKKAGSDEDLAFKSFNLSYLRTAPNPVREIRKIRREADLLKQLPLHPNLVKCIDIVQEATIHLYFVLELCAGGDLLKALQSRPGSPPRFHESEAQFIFKQLINALGFLHDNGVIHRDIKLENVLISAEVIVEVLLYGLLSKYSVKLADYGLARYASLSMCSTVGSPRYMAPEVKNMSGTHHFEADIWSLGILNFLMLKGHFPCEGLPDVPQDTLDLAIKNMDVSDDAKSVVKGTLQKDPSERLTIQQLKGHPWVAADFADLAAPTTQVLQRRRLTKKTAVPSPPSGVVQQPSKRIKSNSQMIDLTAPQELACPGAQELAQLSVRSIVRSRDAFLKEVSTERAEEKKKRKANGDVEDSVTEVSTQSLYDVTSKAHVQTKVTTHNSTKKTGKDGSTTLLKSWTEKNIKYV